MKRKLAITTAIITAMLVLSFCLFLLVLRPRIVDSLLLKAETYMDKKEYSLAEKEINSVYALHSGNLDAHILNYRLLLITGKDKKELFDFVKKAHGKTKNIYFKNLTEDYEKEIKDSPRLNFESGNYAREFIVKVINQKEGENIFYTLNGEKHSYTGEIKIPQGRTQLLLFREGEKGGREYIFYVGDTVEKATLSHQSGVYDAPFYLNITSEGEVFYTLDGLSPTENSEKFIAPLKIEKNTMLKYFVKTKDGYSATFTKYYIFNDNKMQQNPVSMAEDFYINSWENFSLYRNSQILSVLRGSDLCIGEENLYFISRDFKNGIYKVSKEGGLEECLFNKNASSLKNIGQFLFYIDEKDSSLWLCDCNGKNFIKLYDNVSHYTIKNKYIYFLREGTLYKSVLFSKTEEKLIENVETFDVSSGEEIYYITKDKKLYKKVGEQNLAISEGNVTSFALSPFDDKICFVSDNVLYYDGKEREKGFIYSPSFSENSLCYYVIDHKGEYIKKLALD